MHRTRPPISAHLATMTVVATLLGGCSVYDGDYRFRPQPAEVSLGGTDSPAGGRVRTLASVIGVRRASPDEGLPASVEVRLLVENQAPEAIVIDPGRLALVAGNLERFPPPVTEPGSPVTVATGATETVKAWFPFPDDRYPGTIDLSGLNLEWWLELSGRSVAQSVSFERRRVVRAVYPHHHHHRFHSHFGFGFGYGCD